MLYVNNFTAIVPRCKYENVREIINQSGLLSNLHMHPSNQIGCLATRMYDIFVMGMNRKRSH